MKLTHTATSYNRLLLKDDNNLVHLSFFTVFS
jgi:hypothetical protein